MLRFLCLLFSRFVFLSVLLGAYATTSAQIKEVNFLGKKWFVHGVDMRLKYRNYRPDYYKKIVSEADYPSVAYKSDLLGDFVSVNYDNLQAFNTIAVGAVLRPFAQSHLSFIRQLEFAHNLEIERVNMSLTYKKMRSSDVTVRIRSLDMGYNPRFVISSPRVAEFIKFYASADGYVYAPIISAVYTNPERQYLPSGSAGYSKNKEYYSDRLSSSRFKYGIGMSAGIKINVDCNWNFHFAYSLFDVYTYHNVSRYTSVSGNSGVQFGVRYKFGVPSEDDQENKTSVFW